MTRNYDIIIVGGGISGAIAGIAASRCGVEVLVVEQHGFLGGMLTCAGVGPMMTFHAGQWQVIKGITSELIDRLKAAGKSTGHISDSTGYVSTVTPFDVEAMKFELESMLLESDGKILYHTMLAGVNRSGSKIDDIVVCNKAGLSRLKARVYIDATGDADMSAWAGVDFIKGRDGDGKCQPMTLKFKMINVDSDQIRKYIKANIEDFPSINGDLSLIENALRLSIGGFKKIVENARKDGRFDLARDSILMFETDTSGHMIINTSRILDHDATDPFSLSDAEIIGRRQVRQLAKFLVDDVPGFENAQLICSGPNIGVRSSRQIRGLYTLGVEDVLSFRKFDDSIACSAYPIDIHPPEGGIIEDFAGHFKGGDYYTIPYRCLVNDAVDNLVTVGRCISADFSAQAAIRTAPTVGAIGHGGGVGAAISVKENILCRDVPTEKLHELLESQNALFILEQEKN